jgi:hypothetical protein
MLSAKDLSFLIKGNKGCYIPTSAKIKLVEAVVKIPNPSISKGSYKMPACIHYLHPQTVSHPVMKLKNALHFLGAIAAIQWYMPPSVG